MSAAILGRQVKLQNASARCDYCHTPVRFGYQVSVGPVTGFFCGPRHYRAAVDHVDQIKAETGIKSESDEIEEI